MIRSVDSLIGRAQVVLWLCVPVLGFAGLLTFLDGRFPVALLVIPAVVAVQIVLSRGRRRLLARALAHARRQLGAPADQTGTKVEGCRGDAAISIDYRIVISRGGRGGKSETRYTTISATGPGVPLQLDLWRQGPYGIATAAAGLAVDVQTGDRRFDRRYIVEGAPRSVVERLLTPAVTAALCRQSPRRLKLEDGKLALEFGGWRLLPRQIDDFVAIAARLAGDAPAVFAELDAEGVVAEQTPYRESIDATEANRARRERAEDMERLHATIARRRQMLQRIGTAGLVLIWLGIAAAIAAVYFR